MATSAARSDEELLRQFDEENARLRATVPAEGLTEFDMDIAVLRAELEAELAELDDDDEDDEGDEDDGPAAFSTPGLVEFCRAGSPCKDGGDVVRRKGVIWRAEAYPSQGFEMGPAELAEYARNFRPIPIRHAHSSAAGPLDGSFGELESVEMAADGRTLLGTAAFPKWLEEKLGDARRFVSATFDRATRKMRSLDLVTHPQISDAELLAAFSRARTQTTRTAMPTNQTETPEQYARRVCVQHNGRNRLAASSARSRPAEFAAGTPTDVETPEAYARRVVARHNGDNRLTPAAFSATATMPAPPAAPPVFHTQVIQLPPPPTEAEDREFVARLAALGPDLAATAIRSAIAGLEGQVRRAPHGGNFNWPGPVRGHVERIARLEAMLAAVEAGAAYRAPSPESTRERQGRTIATLALASGGTSAADLVAALFGRVNFVRPKAEESGRAVDALLRAFAYHGGGDLGDLEARYHAAARESESWRLELEAAERTAGGFGPALASAVGRAVEAAGGREQVIRDVADVRLVDATGPGGDPDEAELAEVDGRLKALGTGSAGRVAEGLRARREELSASLEARRAEARDRAVAESTTLVEDALAGRVSAWKRLSDAVQGSPAAFAAGFGSALESCPRPASPAARA